MISKILNWKTASITQGASLLAIFSMLSAGLGLVRDRLLASQFGAGAELDAYFAAFRVPDFLYNLLVLGGVSAVFLPLFAEYMEKNKEQAWKFVNNLLHTVAILVGVLALLVAFFAPFLVNLIAPGFSLEQKHVMVTLVQLMLVSPVLFAVSSVFSGILQYSSRFFWYALAPVVYNLGIIGGIIFLTPLFGIFGVGLGVVIGALLHVLIQLPSAIISGFSWKPVLNFGDQGIRKAFLLALPRTIGGVAYHFNLVVMTALASLFATGSVTALGFADRFQQFPIGIVAIPFALAAFPVLSRLSARRDKAQFVSTLFSTFFRVALHALPLALILFFFRDLLVDLVLKVGKFGQADARLTASLLGMFALGILFQVFIPLLIRAFYSLHDTKTPTLISIATVAFNILFASFFVLRGASILVLHLSIVLSGVLQCALLVFFLRFRIAAFFKNA
ncbi:MAG: murein biosynthesis integral membrane protein MurJ [Candidatus Wildermuthbacteria bacterium]|nr:murein biosynthesis integral membrane protein MurJ [Candidatus Wildermuthbacteria bacterium]